MFVSCDAKAATKNFVDLSRPASKTAKGNPFFPVKVIEVYIYIQEFGRCQSVSRMKCNTGSCNETDKYLKKI